MLAVEKMTSMALNTSHTISLYRTKGYLPPEFAIRMLDIRDVTDV